MLGGLEQGVPEEEESAKRQELVCTALLAEQPNKTDTEHKKIKYAPRQCVRNFMRSSSLELTQIKIHIQLSAPRAFATSIGALFLLQILCQEHNFLDTRHEKEKPSEQHSSFMTRNTKEAADNSNSVTS